MIQAAQLSMDWMCCNRNTERPARIEFCRNPNTSCWARVTAVLDDRLRLMIHILCSWPTQHQPLIILHREAHPVRLDQIFINTQPCLACDQPHTLGHHGIQSHPISALTLYWLEQSGSPMGGNEMGCQRTGVPAPPEHWWFVSDWPSIRCTELAKVLNIKMEMVSMQWSPSRWSTSICPSISPEGGLLDGTSQGGSETSDQDVMINPINNTVLYTNEQTSPESMASQMSEMALGTHNKREWLIGKPFTASKWCRQYCLHECKHQILCWSYNAGISAESIVLQ